jgi:hypothetical protein
MLLVRVERGLIISGHKNYGCMPAASHEVRNFEERPPLSASPRNQLQHIMHQENESERPASGLLSITREGPLGQTWRALRRWYIGIGLGSVLGLELGVRS